MEGGGRVAYQATSNELPLIRQESAFQWLPGERQVFVLVMPFVFKREREREREEREMFERERCWRERSFEKEDRDGMFEREKDVGEREREMFEREEGERDV